MASEAKFTPGPWRAGRPDMDSECGGCGMAFKNVYAEDVRGGFHKPTGQPLPLTIAKAVSELTGGSAIEELQITTAELHANALLIAASPELYHALSDMVANESMVEAAHAKAGQPYLNTALAPARAALNKANPSPA